MPTPKFFSPTMAAELYTKRSYGWTHAELAKYFQCSINTVQRTLARPAKEDQKTSRKLQPCGTNAAYERHRRKGEIADQACLDAHARRRLEHIKNDPLYREKRKKWNRAAYARAKSKSLSTGIPVSVLLSVRKSTKAK